MRAVCPLVQLLIQLTTMYCSLYIFSYTSVVPPPKVIQLTNIHCLRKNSFAVGLQHIPLLHANYIFLDFFCETLVV